MSDDPLKRKKLPDEWDPPEGSQTFYRHTTTGDQGWLVRRDGQTRIRLDRPSQEITKPFRKTEWVKEDTHRPLSPFQVVRICFEADKALCKALGMHAEGRKEWESLKDEQRIDWNENGPPKGKSERSVLYAAVRKAMQRYM